MSVRRVKLAMFKASLWESRGDTADLEQKIASLESEIAVEARLREIEAKRPKRGRPRKKRTRRLAAGATETRAIYYGTDNMVSVGCSRTAFGFVTLIR